MCDWSIFTLFVLNRGWKRDSLQIMKFVYVCSTWVKFELKTHFEMRITRNVVNGVRLFHFSYLITLVAYLCSQLTPDIQNKNFMFDCSIFPLFVLNRAWERYSIQIIIFVYVSSTLKLVELKTCFESWKTRSDQNGVSLFHLTYLITLVAYLCWKWTPNVQINCFAFHCSIHIQIVLNRAWKRESFQITIFVFVCSAWRIVELKKRFEAWITTIK
jgi:hypothetical protein